MSPVRCAEEAKVSKGLSQIKTMQSPLVRPMIADVAKFLPTDSRTMVRGEFYLKIAIVVASVLTLAGVILSGKFHVRYHLLPDTRMGNLIWYSTLAYGAMMYAVLVWRIILWRRYKPMESVADKDLPTVSVIIPAFNEGALVRQSILSVAASNYPCKKVEIIAIDDGSTDDTWNHIQAAAAQLDTGIQITTFKQPKNMGKRHALYRGFTRATGDVFVTIDSDSVLHPLALRNAVTPLVVEPEIGCVAGCVEVLNPRQSVITRFLKTTFSLSFKFVRAYQSEFRGVFCTPGALSIYRADVVKKVMNEWLNQEFLGLPCTTGEDRAMTNLILREGWLTAYQGNAVVYSKMPHTYVGMVKMLLRWGRSNIRETIFLFKFLFTRFRATYLRRFQFNMLLTALTLILPPLLTLNSGLLLVYTSGYVLKQIAFLILYAATMSIIYYRNERDSDWVWLFVYEFAWVPGFSWIIPYAAFTMRNTGWLTRAAGPQIASDQSRPQHVDQQMRPALAPAAMLEPVAA